ncbi:hypothetical protein NPIL_451201 [Nephila pilipes]|uniref:Uncharacterized protein n=1 Tax=Nephila pilipes TaxID=299642 RepID=A0A8X6TI61_NEPPI|nr:hypothetical protein NPIL_451201 [Nephila pilipes]
MSISTSEAIPLIKEAYKDDILSRALVFLRFREFKKRRMTVRHPTTTNPSAQKRSADYLCSINCLSFLQESMDVRYIVTKDYAHPHVAKVSLQFLQDHNVNVFADSPARDFSQSKNVWSMMG